MKLKLGHIVAPRNHAGTLRSGGSQYDFAIVVSLDPFQLVSYEADMYWSTTHVEENFQFVGIAPPDVFNRCIQRVEPENQWRMPQGESLMHNVLGNGLTLLLLGTISVAMDLKEFGRWYEDSEKLNNASYGWFFEYKADANMWKAMRKGSDAEIEAAAKQAARGIVHSARGRGLSFVSSVKLQEDFDRLDAEGRRIYVEHFLGRGVPEFLQRRPEPARGFASWGGSGGGHGGVIASAVGVGRSFGGGGGGGSGFTVGAGGGGGGASLGISPDDRSFGYVYQGVPHVEELPARTEYQPSDMYWNVLLEEESVQVGFPQGIREQIPAAQMQAIHKQILTFMHGKAVADIEIGDIENMVRPWFNAMVDSGVIDIPKGD